MKQLDLFNMQPEEAPEEDIPAAKPASEYIATVLFEEPIEEVKQESTDIPAPPIEDPENVFFVEAVEVTMVEESADPGIHIETIAEELFIEQTDEIQPEESQVITAIDVEDELLITEPPVMMAPAATITENKDNHKKNTFFGSSQNTSSKIKVISKRGRKSYKETDVEIALVEVPDDEILFQKQYYSMGEVAGWFNVNNSLLRLWENEFDILKPRKNRKGDRLFRPEDIKNLQLIYYLLRNCKYSMEGAKQYLKDNKKKADLDMRLIASLTKFRSFLLELQANLQP